jgi:D-cysteine desulfhydrase
MSDHPCSKAGGPAEIDAALATLPRVRLGNFPTPVEPLEALAPGLWVKREDLSGEPLGGNKVRALELLLGAVRPGDRVTSVGAAGSTHVLATAVYARTLGARPLVYRWRQEMNATAREVAARIAREVDRAPVVRTVTGAYARALMARCRGAHWVPAGGSSPLGVLGQVAAGLELARQVDEGLMPAPRRIVLPLGTGGTAAGVALGTAIGGLASEIIAVRVVPRLVANAGRVQRLVRRTARLLGRLTGTPVLAPPAPIRVVHDFYGGAYGRPLPAGEEAAVRGLALADLAIDATYAAKALAAAVEIAERQHGTTLFWLSFDGRWLPPRDRVALR